MSMSQKPSQKTPFEYKQSEIAKVDRLTEQIDKLNQRYTPGGELKDFDDNFDTKQLGQYIEFKLSKKMDELADEVDQMLDNM